MSQGFICIVLQRRYIHTSNTFHCSELIDTVTLNARGQGNLVPDCKATTLYNERKNTDFWWRLSQIGLSCNF